ncbi:MAG TPA: glycosyltransferase family 2 protein [Thermoanaerobaculia bacterium]|jgi:GT2 family glycosyltransferase|nr:glycosyltransferase family 2 protein [Thermoanaerobaculia bacterium]
MGVNDDRPAGAQPPSVAAVVVTFNSEATIVACVNSLLASPVVTEVVVVDNRSTDDTLSRLASIDDPRLRLQAMPRNVGFGRAVNHGAAATKAPLLAIVNPDAVSHRDTIDVLRDAIASREFWAAGPALLNSQGQREHSARAFPTEENALYNWRYLQLFPETTHESVTSFLMLDRDLHEDFECDWLSGAFVLAWRDGFEAIGGFDPAYFLYYEDVDLFRRARNLGHRARFVGAATAEHLIGGSAKSVPFRAGVRRIGGFVRYYRTHLRKNIASDVRFAFYLIAGIALLALAPFLRRG